MVHLARKVYAISLSDYSLKRGTDVLVCNKFTQKRQILHFITLLVIARFLPNLYKVYIAVKFGDSRNIRPVFNIFFL